jgi:hypothetical protein
MTSTKKPGTDARVEHHPPSRPGIKFVLCVIAVAIAIAVIILRN